MTSIPRLLQYAYFPLLFAGFNIAAIALTQLQAGFGSLVMLMVVALLSSFVAERVIPYNREWNRPLGDRLRDALHFVVNESSNYIGVFLLPLISGLALWPSMWPQDWPFWTQVLLAIVVFDVGTTLFHLLSHRSSLLWRFHAVHHASKRLYGLNGIMKHPLFQLMNALVALGPLVIIGIPQDVAAALVFSIFLQLLIQHSNADMRTGPFRRVFATAEVHRFHHLQGKAGDVNFGLFFSVWDFLLGTAYFETRGAPLHTTDIGIDRASHYPVDYWGQFKAPFQNTPRTDESVILESGPALMNASTSGRT